LIDQLIEKYYFETFSEFMQTMFTDNQRKCRAVAEAQKKKYMLALEIKIHIVFNVKKRL
jgi:hypothetical protein